MLAYKVFESRSTYLLGLSNIEFIVYRLPAELYHDNDEYVFSQILHVCQIQVSL